MKYPHMFITMTSLEFSEHRKQHLENTVTGDHDPPQAQVLYVIIELFIK